MLSCYDSLTKANAIAEENESTRFRRAYDYCQFGRWTAKKKMRSQLAERIGITPSHFGSYTVSKAIRFTTLDICEVYSSVTFLVTMSSFFIFLQPCDQG